MPNLGWEKIVIGPMFIALTALVTAMLSIQGGAALSKQLLPVIGGGGAITLRLSCAAVMVAALRRPWRGAPIAPQHWRDIVLYGLSLGAMNFLFYQALGRIPLGIAVALEFTGPLLLSVAYSRRILDGLWILLAGIGMALLLPDLQATGFNTATGNRSDLVGVVLALAAGGFWASYIVFGRRVGMAIPIGRASALGIIIAALVFAPLGSLTASASLWSWSYLPIGLAIGFFSSALPYSLEMYALKTVPTRSFGILMSLEPAVATIIGMIVLHENLDSTQALAIGLIVLASLGSAL